MQTKKIDILNTFLIVFSLIIAYLLPFQLFIVAYAILGPLHYFTEINWIRDKNYFSPSKYWIHLVVIFSCVLAIPYLLRLSLFETITNHYIFSFIKYNLPSILNALFFIGICVAASYVFIKRQKTRNFILLFSFLFAFILHQFPLYHVIFGLLIPTVIHVYFFTILFMWYGMLKNQNIIGILNIILMILVPILISFITIHQDFYHFSTTIKSVIIDNNFHVLNVTMAKILGLSDGTTFFFYEKLELKIQIFIAFAYTYHYLNWFSKTTLIGWHKKITTKKSISILILWSIAMSLYYYDYTLGIGLLIFSSFLHVFMEFPLNFITIKELVHSLLKR